MGVRASDRWAVWTPTIGNNSKLAAKTISPFKPMWVSVLWRLPAVRAVYCKCMNEEGTREEQTKTEIPTQNATNTQRAHIAYPRPRSVFFFVCEATACDRDTVSVYERACECVRTTSGRTDGVRSTFATCTFISCDDSRVRTTKNKTCKRIFHQLNKWYVSVKNIFYRAQEIRTFKCSNNQPRRKKSEIQYFFPPTKIDTETNKNKCHRNESTQRGLTKFDEHSCGFQLNLN